MMNASLQSRRTWLVGGAAVAAVIAAASWFFVISPVTSDTDSVKSQTASVKDQNRLGQQKLRDLANSRSQLPGLQAELVSALEALPMANGLPDFTRQLNRQAAALRLTLDSLTVGGFTTPSVVSAGTTAGSAPAATNATAATPPPATAGAPVTAGGPVAISVTLSSTGPAKAQLSFLRAIRLNGPRRALVTAVSFSAPQKAGGTTEVTMTVTLTVFATPQSADQRARIVKLLKLK